MAARPSIARTLPTVAAVPGVAVALLAIGAFLPSLPGTFIVDDWLIVVENPLVTDFNLPAILTSDYWGPGANNGQYRPLTVFSYAANRALFGPDAFSFRVVNILLHAAVSLALFALAKSLAFPPVAAWLTAALFAIHPIHLEPVNTIVGRAELLAALFGFCFLILARSAIPARRAGGLVCLLAALLSKESSAAFPAILVTVDLFTGASPGAVLRSRRGYYGAIAGVATCWLLLRAWVQHASGVPPAPIDPHDNPLAFLAPLPRVLSALKVQLLYLGRHAAPLGIHGVYEASSVRPVTTLFSPWGTLATSSAIATAALLVRFWRRRSLVTIGMAIYVLGFAVTANILFPHYVMMADRLAYLPSAGFCLAVAAALGAAAPTSSPAPSSRPWLPALVLAYLAALGLVTLQRNPLYREPRLLWERTVAAEPANARAWIYLGDVYGRAGDLRRAESAYRAAIEAAPRFFGGWEMLAYVLVLQGRTGEAVSAYRQELAVAGRELPAVRLKLAHALLELGRPSEALRELAEVSRVDLQDERRRLEALAIDQVKAADR